MLINVTKLKKSIIFICKIDSHKLKVIDDTYYVYVGMKTFNISLILLYTNLLVGTLQQLYA